MAGQNTLAITDTTFSNEVLDSEIPTLVDFWATWCAPCKAIAPMLENAAQDYDGLLKITKMDLGTGMKFAQQYGITAIPALLLFKKGEVVARHVGALNRSALDRLVQPHLHNT